MNCVVTTMRDPQAPHPAPPAMIKSLLSRSAESWRNLFFFVLVCDEKQVHREVFAVAHKAETVV